MFASLLSGMEIAVMSEVKIGAQASLLALSAGREQPFDNWLVEYQTGGCRLSTAWQARMLTLQSQDFQ